MASCHKKVKEYTDKELKYLVLGLILRTHAECGHKEDEGIIDMTIDLFIRDLQVHRRNISFEEIELAFRNGYKGEYGEWFGLNNKTYSQWISGFVLSVNRVNAIKEKEKLLQPKDIVLSEQEKKQIIHDGAILAFKEFKEKGEVMDIGNVTYHYLDSLGLLKFDNGRKFDFLNKAQHFLKMERQNALQSCKDSIKRKELMDSLEEINNAQGNQVKSIAKRIALNTYFKDLVDMDMELETEISLTK